MAERFTAAQWAAICELAAGHSGFFAKRSWPALEALVRRGIVDVDRARALGRIYPYALTARGWRLAGKQPPKLRRVG